MSLKILAILSLLTSLSANADTPGYGTSTDVSDRKEYLLSVKVGQSGDNGFVGRRCVTQDGYALFGTRSDNAYVLNTYLAKGKESATLGTFGVYNSINIQPKPVSDGVQLRIIYEYSKLERLEDVLVDNKLHHQVPHLQAVSGVTTIVTELGREEDISMTLKNNEGVELQKYLTVKVDNRKSVNLCH